MSEQKEFAIFWRNRDYGDMELLRARYITHSFAPHYHEEFALGVIERGAEVFDYRGKAHIWKPGQVCILNPFEVQTGHALTELGWVYRMFYPGMTLMRQITTEVTGRINATPFFDQPVIDDAELAGLLLLTHQALEDRNSMLLQRTQLMHAALGILIRRHSSLRTDAAVQPENPVAVRHVRDYIDAHYDEDVTIDHLSKVAAFSPYHLIRVFRRETGLTPHQYLMQQRLIRAQVLLRAGVPIRDVAVQTGFTDQSHLTRRFKQMVGVTPGQFVGGNQD